MESTTEIQSIASESARMIVELFLQSIPSELEAQLPPGYCSDMGNDLLADIQSCLHSRLQWSLASAQVEIDEQHQQQQKPKSQHQMDFLPPEPIQKLPERELRSHQQPSHQIIQQPIISDASAYVEEAATPDANIEETQTQPTLNKSPNHQKRRRRRSAAAEYQESLLNST